jgi:hypothetical protein
MNKILALLLSIVFVCSVFSIVEIQFVNASSNVPMPQFTVRYIDESYDASTSPSTNPYTGDVTPPTSYHIDRRYIQVSIRNDLPKIPEGSPFEYYYNVHSKGQFAEDWSEGRTAAYGFYRPSESAYTMINYTLADFSISGQEPPWGTKIDFQVILMYGVIGRDTSQGPLGPEYFSGETSGWSSTRTVTIGDTSTPIENAPPTQTPTTEPTQTQTATTSPTSCSTLSRTPQGFELAKDWQTVVITMLVIVVILLVGVVVLQRKKSNNKEGSIYSCGPSLKK